MAKLNKELEQAIVNSDKMREDMSKITMDAVAGVPLAETDVQTKMTKKQIEEYDAPVIKPSKSMPSTGKPLDKEKAMREDGWKYIKVIAENNEVVGERVDFWHKKFAGDPIYYWEIPVNKPIYVPKHIAQHLSERKYHVFKMQDRSREGLQHGDYAQSLICQETRRRIDCRSVQFGF